MFLLFLFFVLIFDGLISFFSRKCIDFVCYGFFSAILAVFYQ